MSTYLGNQLLSGVATNTISNAHSLFDFKWTDHILNEMSWLRADTYSWHNGLLYKAAYNHLVEDVNGKSADNSDTIGSYTIWYVLADDGHKIIGPDQEETANNIYNESGVSWYYILDTTNQKFKLPRTKYGFVGLRDSVGNYIPESLPNIKGAADVAQGAGYDYRAEGAFAKVGGSGGNWDTGANCRLDFNASRSSSAYQDNAPVQQRSTQMYLYFYVGEYSQSQAEQVATLDVEMFNNKADTNMLNLTDVGKNIGNWSSNVTNCITDIPQDIKLELNNGTLTLKAGSKVYVPNGFESDGTTPKFDVVTIESDILQTSVQANGICTLYYNTINNTLNLYYTYSESSGTSAPSGDGTFYNTSTNELNRYNGGVKGYKLSLPLAHITDGTSTITSIDQVFNGFGYIGSTVFALPGVKGLIPNGRNADGTLKNIDFTIDSVKTATRTWNDGGGQIFVYTQNPPTGFPEFWYFNLYIESEIEPVRNEYVIWYKPSENITFIHNAAQSSTPSWERINCINFGFAPGINSKEVKIFATKTVFHALDYNDKGTVAGWGMPSDRYISLTLGASGSSYIAPANGYFCLSKVANGGTQYANLINSAKNVRIIGTATSGVYIYIYIPAAKGDTVYCYYNATGTTEFLRFVYAEGEV